MSSSCTIPFADQIEVVSWGAALPLALELAIAQGQALPEISDGLDVSQWKTLEACEPFLRDRKSLKFMAKQDRLALIAAGNAVAQAKLVAPEISETCLGARTGLFYAVGLLPFEKEHLDILANKSMTDAKFSMERFSREAYLAVNPLLTFKCLPNMPLFHISMNLGIKHSYMVTYPRQEAFLQCLTEACWDLQSGSIELALVGAVIDQNNELMNWYFKKQGWGPEVQAIDGSIAFILRKSASNQSLKLSQLPSIPALSKFLQPEALDLPLTWLSSLAQHMRDQ